MSAAPRGERAGRPSVRTRVSLACAGVAVAIVVTLAVLVVVVLSRREYASLDRRLAVVSEALASSVSSDFPDGLDEAVGRSRGRLIRALAPGLVATVGQDGVALRTVSAPGTDVGEPDELPVAQLGTRTVEVGGGGGYRLLTVAIDGVPGGTLSVGLPAELAAAPVRAIRLWGIVIGALAALAGAGLGWLAAGVAVRPLRQLRDRTRLVDGRSPMPTREELTAGSPGSAAETEQLADAIAGLLQRVQLARDATDQALTNARDFAAAADHELRTPLTTIQTDLEVLLAHPDLDREQRREILDEVVGAKTRMLETLAALRALADGDVAARGYGSYATRVDLAELACRCVEAARPRAPAGVELSVVLPEADPDSAGDTAGDTAGDEVEVLGSPGGLRLAIDNLIRNALRHARAHRVEVSVHRRDGWITVRVDDDGSGLPEAERAQVFARFARGSTAVGSGSGLGLALAAQQAALHGGSARLTDNPWGGLRAQLDLPAVRPD